MAAPVEIEDPNWHRSETLQKECEWKQGDSAGVNLGRTRKYWRLPLVGRDLDKGTRPEQLSKKGGRLTMRSASRWSAIRCTAEATEKSS